MPILDISRLLLPLLALISPDLKIDIVHHALHSCLQTLHRWQFILPCSFNDWLHSKEQVLKYVMRCVATPSWVFFTFFKLYIWYQIAQRITYLSHRYLNIYLIVLDIISNKTCSIVFNNFFLFFVLWMFWAIYLLCLVPSGRSRNIFLLLLKVIYFGHIFWTLFLLWGCCFSFSGISVKERFNGNKT